MTAQKPQIETLGELRKSGYKSRPVKEELRENLVQALREKRKPFPQILGFEDSVLPDLERAILSRHNLLLLGLRGQAKTRIARGLVQLLDEWLPIVAGSEINDDPFAPLSFFARQQITQLGEQTPIEWLHRSERYVEKLATPDVSVADLIGDLDPIKAASQRLSYADERSLHFGLIPRAHRCLFIINELPDLQARIQVALFNILQEGDLQIRGFKLRLPVDVGFVFTANPEDYTNRGSIVTPLKDRIESQILTHYPKTLNIAQAITAQEAQLSPAQQEKIYLPPVAARLIERLAFAARESEMVDEKSGISARLSIAAYENLISTAERRMLLNNADSTQVRMSDFQGIFPALTGKMELVYEGEQLGPLAVAQTLLAQAVKAEFLEFFPNPEGQKRNAKKQKNERDPYSALMTYFGNGQTLSLPLDLNDADYCLRLENLPGMERLLSKYLNDHDDAYFYMELILHALVAFGQLEAELSQMQLDFKDPLGELFDL